MPDPIATVSVVGQAPELASHLGHAQAAGARVRARAPAISLAKGEFSPMEEFPRRPGTLGMLVVDGVLLRGVSVTDRPSVEVMGPGDVVRPFDGEFDPYAMVSVTVRWWALMPARVALLDAAFLRAMSDYPGVIAELAGRLWRRSTAGSLRLAMVQEHCLATRLHFLLWQLAHRFGHAEAEGTVLPVPLCHALLSWLVGARRPAVSRAVNELERVELLARRADGTWWVGRPTAAEVVELPLIEGPVAA
jgi:hypothetical protein